MEVLRHYAWPGNVRELIHVIEQSVVLCDGSVITVEDLPPPVRGELVQPLVGDDDGVPSLREMERRYIFWVLGKVGGSRAKAAHALGVTERTFYRLLERHRKRADASSTAHPRPAAAD